MIQNNPAGFKLRLLAASADWAIWLLLTTLFFSLSASLSNSVQELIYKIVIYFTFIFLPLTLFIGFFYNPYFNTRFGGNLGKLLTGIRVQNEEGRPLSFKRNFFRHTVGYQFSGLLFGLGFLSIIKDTNKQGWHDKAVGSKVVVTSNRWLLSLLILLLLVLVNSYLISTSVYNFSSGTLIVEITELLKEL